MKNPLPLSVAAELRELFLVVGKCPEIKEETLEEYVIFTAMGPTYF